MPNALPRNLTILIREAVKPGENSFKFRKRVKPHLRELTQTNLNQHYQPIELDGTVWEIKASVPWSRDLPVTITGKLHEP